MLDVARKHGDSPDVYNTLKSKLEHQLVSASNTVHTFMAEDLELHLNGFVFRSALPRKET